MPEAPVDVDRELGRPETRSARRRSPRYRRGTEARARKSVHLRSLDTESQRLLTDWCRVVLTG